MSGFEVTASSIQYSVIQKRKINYPVFIIRSASAVALHNFPDVQTFFVELQPPLSFLYCFSPQLFAITLTSLKMNFLPLIFAIFFIWLSLHRALLNTVFLSLVFSWDLIVTFGLKD